MPVIATGDTAYGRCYASRKGAMIHLVVFYEDRGFQWPLKDHYPVYAYTANHHLLARLSGEYLRHLVERELKGVVLQEGLRQALVPPRLPLAPARPRFLSDPQQRAALRTRRRQRRTG